MKPITKKALLAGVAMSVVVSLAAVGVHYSQENRVMAAEKEASTSKQLAHMVYFTCANEADTKQLVANCKKYLGEHPGTVYFSVGTLNPDLKREVNVTDFSVALNLVFKDRAAQDVYQESPRHQEFISSSKSLWNKVRVYDSDIQ
ncbi:MAG: Dabb family protein [Planctomycetota bacterium]|nr:Dabb family protein [Planctomycetota bacterium]